MGTSGPRTRLTSSASVIRPVDHASSSPPSASLPAAPTRSARFRAQLLGGGDGLDVLQPDVALGVDLLGHRLVLGHGGVDVGVGEPDPAHVGEGLADLGAPQPDLLEDRDDAQEQIAAELALALAVRDVLVHLRRQPEAAPDLLAEEAVAHAVAGVDAELLTVV